MSEQSSFLHSVYIFSILLIQNECGSILLHSICQEKGCFGISDRINCLSVELSVEHQFEPAWVLSFKWHTVRTTEAARMALLQLQAREASRLLVSPVCGAEMGTVLRMSK